MKIKVSYRVMDRDQYEGRKAYSLCPTESIKVDVLHESDAVAVAQDVLTDAIIEAGRDYCGVRHRSFGSTPDTIVVTDADGEIIEAYDYWTTSADLSSVDAVVEFCDSVESWDAPYIDEAFEALAYYAGLDMDDYPGNNCRLDIGAFLDAVDAKLHTHLN